MIATCFFASGCTTTHSPPQTSKSQQPLHAPASAQPQPPQIALAAPASVDNEAIAQFIATLAAQGAPEVAQGIWVQSNNELLANHQGTAPLPAASITKVATSLGHLEK